jgi:hypothetical protein
MLDFLFIACGLAGILGLGAALIESRQRIESLENRIGVLENTLYDHGIYASPFIPPGDPAP